MMSACGSNSPRTAALRAFRGFVAGRHWLPVENPLLALAEDALDQRQIVGPLGTPPLGRKADEIDQPFGGLLQRRPGGAGDGDQLAIEPAAVVFATAVLDLSGAPPGQAPAITPADHRRPQQVSRLAQQPRHEAHGIP